MDTGVDTFGHNVVADVASISVIAASFAGMLPSVATLFTIAYFGTLLYDRWKYGPKHTRHDEVNEHGISIDRHEPSDYQ